MTTPTFAKTYNLIAYLAKPAESEGFEQIIDFLNGSSVRHALTTSFTIRTSCIKQFWSTSNVKKVNDEVRVQALIDAKRVNIKESSIRHILKLDDEEGTSCLANDEIFCLSAKTTSWNEFSSTMASAIKRLATNQKFNFSRYILLSLVKNKEAGVHFYMFPRFVQLIVDHQLGDMSHHQDIYDNPSLTKKVFANMKRVGTGFSEVITPLFENMLVPAAKEVGQAQDDVSIPTEPSTSKPHKKYKSKNNNQKHLSLKFQELMDLCARLSNKVMDLESEVIGIKSSFTDKIAKLEDRVHKLGEENRILKEKSFKYAKINTAAPVEDNEESFKQGRMIADMDEDVKEEPAKVEEVLEVITAAKLITEVVTTAEPTTTAAQVPKARAPRKIRGVVIHEPEETATLVIVHIEVRPKDKEKGILIEEPKPLKGQPYIDIDEAFAIQLEAERKPLTEAQTRKNMMIYLKNMAGFKMNFFKGMTYREIRPLFEKHYNSIQAFLEKVKEEVTVQEKKIEEEGNKRQGESLKQEIAKKQRMNEEAKELKRHL
nr:hypothetical protein [Tanacetum cinerariifolium]